MASWTQKKAIYQVTKQCAKETKGMVNVAIRYERGTLSVEEEKIKLRWRQYFSSLLYTEHWREKLNEDPPFQGPMEEILREEV